MGQIHNTPADSVGSERMLDRIRQRINDSVKEISGIGNKAEGLRDRIFGHKNEDVQKDSETAPPSNGSYQQLLDTCIALEKRIVVLGKVIDELQQIA